MVEKMFDGFEHARYRHEVEQRWGAKARTDGDTWWRSMTDAERTGWKSEMAELNRDWIEAAERGIDPTSDDAQALARRHVQWLRSIPGTPAAAADGDTKAYVIGLGEMYVADPRFGANYATSAGGTVGAEFVRDALRSYAESAL